MILIGQYDSPFVRRVAIALHRYEIPFDRRVLSVFKDFDEILIAAYGDRSVGTREPCVARGTGAPRKHTVVR